MPRCRSTCPWPPFFQQWKDVIAELERARAVHAEIGVTAPGIQRGQRDGRLEGRARRIGAGQRLVDQRLVVVVVQRLATAAA